MDNSTSTSNHLQIQLKKRVEKEIRSINDILISINDELSEILTASRLFEKDEKPQNHLLGKGKINGWEKEKFEDEDLAIYQGLLEIQADHGNPEKLLSDLKQAGEKVTDLKANFMKLRESSIQEAKEFLLNASLTLPSDRKEHFPKPIPLDPGLPKFPKKYLNYPYKFHLKHLRNPNLSKSQHELLNPIVSVLNKQSFGAGTNNSIKILKEIGKKFKLGNLLDPYSSQKEVKRVGKEIRKQKRNPYPWKRECLREYKNICVVSANVQVKMQAYHRKKLMEMIEWIEGSHLGIYKK